jgi:Spy/CpxP family protein refolding chaperone
VPADILENVTKARDIVSPIAKRERDRMLIVGQHVFSDWIVNRELGRMMVVGKAVLLFNVMRLRTFLAIACAGVVAALCTARSEERVVADPLQDRLFPPDLILQNGESIGLSDEKRQEVLTRIEKAQPRFQEREQALHKERDAMLKLLDQEGSNEAALLKKLDQLIDCERELRREQFRLMLSLRGMLTVQQQATLKELRKTHNPAALEARLKEKLAKVETGMQKLANSGNDPSSIAAKMQFFPELMRIGKTKEAETLLDKILKELEAN